MIPSNLTAPELAEAADSTVRSYDFAYYFETDNNYDNVDNDDDDDYNADDDDGREPIEISQLSPPSSNPDLATAGTDGNPAASVKQFTTTATTVKTLLVSALCKARKAVEKDHEGRYPAAVQAYEECINGLTDALAHPEFQQSNPADVGQDIDTIVRTSADRDRLRVQDMLTLYKERHQIISTMIVEMKRNALTPDWRLNELPLGKRDRHGRFQLMRMEASPRWVEHRVYWLLRQLRRSINEGGPLTPSIFIPRDIWLQKGVKFTAIETKFNSLDLLIMWLQKLSNLDITDSPALGEELNEFCAVMDSIRNALARKLRFIKATEKSSNFIGSLSKQMERMHASYARDKLDDTEEYLTLLTKLSDNSQFLAGWLMHFSMLPTAATTDTILARLGRTSDFLHDVICAFVIEDLRLLLSRYMKEMRRSFLAY